MHILSLLSSLLVTSCFAAPSRRASGCLPAGLMDLPSHQTQLVALKGPPSFVTLGVGNQKYTCSSSGKYTSTGAVAQLFDITSLSPGNQFQSIQRDVFLTWAYSTIKDPLDPAVAQLVDRSHNFPVSGKLYFIKADGQLAPVLDFRSFGQTKGNKEAIVVAKITGDIASPTYTAIDWQELSRVSGGLADTVFLINTVGGKPPQDCTPGTADITVKFTAKYFLYGGKVKHC